jgi:hypothetical protein
MAFGYHIYEIPAVLEWKDHKLSKTPGKKRKSSSKINRLIGTHVVFSLLAAPFRYIYALAALLAAAAVGFFGWALYRLLTGEVSVYELIISSLLALFAFLVFGVGLLAQQGRALQRDLWRIRSALQTGEPRQNLSEESARERAREHNAI